ncbi:MAG: hypothetical protein IKW00_03745 [Clostridia bacterium]|nr:hypothetical protein [Clostridia bacterium]
MKKLLAAVLSLVMLLSLSPVCAQEDVPTVDELLAFCDEILSDALKQSPVSPEPAEDGGYVFTYEDYAVYSPDAALTEESRITGVDLFNPDALTEDLRGMAPGYPLSSLLSAYPLDNENLRGTYGEAVLYIRGLLPGTVNVGRTVRNGSHMLIVEHTIYNADGENVEKCCVLYTLENNFIIASQVMLSVQQMTLDEAHAEIENLSLLQEKDEYRVYTAENPEAFTREDLSFSGLDFLTVTPQSALDTLGGALSDTWAQDGSGYIRSMQWNDVQLVFSYDAQKSTSSLELLQVYGDGVEGPRNLHIGDSALSVMNRFERTNLEGAVLYGDGENAPYGKFHVREDGSLYLLYAAQVEDETVLLALTFVDDQLVDMTCTCL